MGLLTLIRSILGSTFRCTDSTEDTGPDTSPNNGPGQNEEQESTSTLESTDDIPTGSNTSTKTATAETVEGPDCAEVPDQTGDRGTIEVNVFYVSLEDSARVVAAYAEYALAWAYGDRYQVDVTLVEDYQPPAECERSADAWAGHVHDDLPAKYDAKDCNAMVGRGPDGIAGGSMAFTGHSESVGDLDPDCILTRHDNERLNVNLHEIGHCLGLDHDDGGRRNGAITPMQSTYQHGSSWTVHYSEEACDRTIEVQ